MDPKLMTEEALERDLLDPQVTGPALQFYEQASSILPEAPRPSPYPAPETHQRITGSRFLVWKQDPTVNPPGLRMTYVPSMVFNGPCDGRIETLLPGITPISSNVRGDFIFRPGSPQFDCCHSFAVGRQTLTMYERLRGGTRIPWAWNSKTNKEKLMLHPRAGVTANAYYSRSQRAVKFFYFTPSRATYPVFTCRSLDIVSHEMGHAILDGLKPGWLGSMGNPPQTGGLHESFGDLTALFLALSQMDQVEAAVTLTKGRLHEKNFLAALAEQFGAVLGRPMGLRNADNDLKLSEVSNEVHSLSQVFTGAIYDILADIYTFEYRRKASQYGPARVLMEVAERLHKLVLEAIIAAPAAGATYTDVVNKMLQISKKQNDPTIYRSIIRSRFTLREIVISPVSLKAQLTGAFDYSDPDYLEGEDLVEMKAFRQVATEVAQDRSGCCGTMRLPEFEFTEPAKLEKGESMTEEELLEKELVPV